MTSEPPDSSNRTKTALTQLAMAIELPFVLIGGVLIGGGIGWLLDRHFHTSPAFTLLFGAIGFGGGMWELIKRLSRLEKNPGDDGG